MPITTLKRLFVAGLAMLAGACATQEVPVVKAVKVENIVPTTEGSFCTVGSKTWLGGIATSPNAPQHAIGKCKHPLWKKSDVIVLYFGDDGAQASQEFLADELDRFLNPSMYLTHEEVAEIAAVECAQGADCDVELALLRKGAVVHFAVDADTPLDQSEVEMIRRIAAIAKARGANMYVVGHTDSTGTNTHNNDLSIRRAESVRKLLIEHGVAPDNILAVGKAAGSPVATNETIDGRAENRRTEVTRR